MSEERPDAAKVFDAAKAIVETLAGLDRDHQERAIRFASESLGLSPPAHVQAPPATGQIVAAASQASPPGGRERPSDIREFMTAKAPKSDQQFAAVVAYYYQFEVPGSQKKESIGADDLTEAARLAGRRRPNKPLKTLNNAKSSGYLDSPERGKFKISTVGENLVAVTLPGNDAAGAATTHIRRARKPGGKPAKQKNKVRRKS
jgi:hypothetical protein